MKKITVCLVMIAAIALCIGVGVKAFAICPDCINDIEYQCNGNCYIDVDICLPDQQGSGVYKLYYRPEDVGAWTSLTLTRGSRVCDENCSNYTGRTGVSCSALYYTCFIQWEPTTGDPVVICAERDYRCE